MTTLHLVYKSLERSLNNRIGAIYILKRRKQIKNILNEYYLLPSVINNIIHKYTDEIIELENYIHSYKILEPVSDMLRISLNFKHDYFNGQLNIYYDNGKFTYFLRNDIHEIVEIIRDNFDDDIYMFNAFMKYYYMRNNYINCKYISDTNVKIIIEKNTILGEYQKYTKLPYFAQCLINNVLKYFKINNTILTGLILDHRKFTYLIVIMKCLINGVQKYFKKHDFVEYCKHKQNFLT